MQQHPKARNDALVVEPLREELLVFDKAAGRAHSLNAAAAAVWRACDGTRDTDSLAALTGLGVDAVTIALRSLSDCELLETAVADGPRVSRRAALRKAALTGATIGAALPVIRSIAAPSVAHAASGCVAYNDTCTGQSCCSHNGRPYACTGNGLCSQSSGTTVGRGGPCSIDAQCRYPAKCFTGIPGEPGTCT